MTNTVSIAERPERPQRLLLPVSLLMAVSVVAICGLVWLNAHSLNENARTTSLKLASSMLAAKSDRLEVLAYDYTWWDDATTNLVTAFDQRWADDNIGSYLTDTYDIASAFVLSADDRTIVGFVNGAASDLEVYARFPAELSTLVTEARDKPMEEPGPVSAYMKVDELIHIVAVAALTPENPTEEQLKPHARPLLILSIPLDDAFLTKAGADYNLNDLRLAAVGEADNGLTLRSVGGGSLARLVWRDERPGADLIEQLWPALAATLAAMAVLLVLVFRDVGRVAERQSGLLSLLERERELRSLRSRFVSMISHELRTPLASIRSSVGLLETYGERMTDDERRVELGKINHAVQSLARLAENALPFGRPDAAEETWHFERIDLAALSRDVWQEATRVCDTQHRLVLTDLSEGQQVLTDEVVMRVILSNLFQNAVRYSPDANEVSVEITAANCETRFQVTDFGPGIADDEMDMIFEAFRRGREARGQEGSGLGLAIARSMAESLGGRLTAENAPGAGARFRLVLPDRPSRPAVLEV